MNEQGVRVADEQIALNDQASLALAKARFDAGSVARLDVLQAEVELANSKARRIQAQAHVDTAYQALRTVLSLPQSQRLVLRGYARRAARAAHARSVLEAGIPRGLICARIHSQRTIARAQRRARERGMEAQPVADGQPAVSGRRRRQLVPDRQPELHVGLALRVPLFSAPGAAARRVVAKAQVRQSEHGLNAATDAARLEVESAWTAFEASDEVVTTQEKALELARESVVDRPGVLRERRDHVGRAQRRAGAPAADRVAADAGEVQPHRARPGRG